MRDRLSQIGAIKGGLAQMDFAVYQSQRDDADFEMVWLTPLEGLPPSATGNMMLEEMGLKPYVMLVVNVRTGEEFVRLTMRPPSGLVQTVDDAKAAQRLVQYYGGRHRVRRKIEKAVAQTKEKYGLSL